MISNLLKSKVVFNKAILFNNSRNFAALSLSAKASDVHAASPKEVGELMKELSKSPDNQNGELCDAIDEYFRQKFRKVSFSDAKDIICGMGFSKNQLNQHIECQKIQGLDDKFWVWETLEEASRP